MGVPRTPSPFDLPRLHLPWLHLPWLHLLWLGLPVARLTLGSTYPTYRGSTSSLLTRTHALPPCAAVTTPTPTLTPTLTLTLTQAW